MKGLFRVLLIYERDSLYKAKIYEFLFFHNKEVPFSILSQLFDLHNTTIKRYLSELQEIEFLKNELFISKTSVICIKKNVLPLELIKYFKANGIFIDILNMIYKNKYLTIECLAQRLYVSSSHLYKIIKELNCRIKIFDLELEMFPKIRITGNIFSAIYLEWSVRTLFYMDEKRKINYEIKQFQRNFRAVFELTSSNNFNDEQKGYYFYYQWLQAIKKIEEKDLITQSFFSKTILTEEAENKLTFLLKAYQIPITKKHIHLAYIGMFFFKVHFDSEFSRLNLLDTKNLLQQTNNQIGYFIKEFQKAFKFKETLVLVSWLIILYGNFFIIDLKLEDSFSYLRYFPKFLKLEKEIRKWLNINFNDEISQYSTLNNLNELFLVMLSYKESLVEPVPKIKILLESSFGNTRKQQLEDYLRSTIEFVDREDNKYDVIIRDDLCFPTSYSNSMYTISEFLEKLQFIFNQFG